MKKILGLTLITILALSSLKANSATFTDEQVKSIVSKQVEQRYAEYTDAEVKVNVVALPFRELELPNGQVKFVVKSDSNKFMPRDMEKVNVYVNSRFVKTFNAPITVKAYQNILVASCIIEREKELNSSLVRIEKREVSNKIDHVLKPEALNKQIVTKKYFVAGEIIDDRFVKLRPEVQRNSIVTVLFNTNNLTVTIDATALSDGSIGDNICIMNKGYNRIYKGTVVGENKVLVKI